ncbi:MAG TPA: universal stress protein [Micromonosporaceae bacterium]
MVHGRIVIGFDGSPAARRALAWAVREAVRRPARLLVVTAYPPAAHPEHPAGSSARVDDLLGLVRAQREAIAAAVAGLGTEPPVVGRQVVIADPVVALCHAGTMADLLVLGVASRDGLATSTAGRIAQAFADRRHRGIACPLVVVPGAEPALPTAETAELVGAIG